MSIRIPNQGPILSRVSGTIGEDSGFFLGMSTNFPSDAQSSSDLEGIRFLTTCTGSNDPNMELLGLNYYRRSGFGELIPSFGHLDPYRGKL